jgi:serine phosphatase RsbU (regulator of sigma subunit)
LLGRTKTGKVERIDTLKLGFPLGLEADIKSFLQTHQVTVYSEDVVIFYTDGITEAENMTKKFYGIERLCQVIEQHLHQDAQSIHQAVVADLKAHIDDHRVFDDITLMVLKRKAPLQLTETSA